jgi:predicted transcriptional regulator
MAEFWIAIAGPIVSIALAIIFYILQSISGALAPLFAVVKYLSYINGALGLFNLIPGFPLDGGRVFRAIVWGISHNFRKATLIAANLGRFIAFIFILFGVWQLFTGNIGNGLWIAFIGWFLESAAGSQLRQQTVHDLLGNHRVSDAMRRDYTVVKPDATLNQLIDEHILGSGKRCLIIEQSGSVMGLLTVHEIKEVPRSKWQTTTAAQIMVPSEKLKRIKPDAQLVDALAEMDRDGVSQLPVMVDGQIQGILGRDDVINLLRNLSEFGSRHDQLPKLPPQV